MKSQYLKKIKLPDKPGVYFFKKNKDILYIGKATSLRSRVKSYFSRDLIATRGPIILDMTVQADRLDWQETDSVLEALILEAELIKKNQPKYNTKEKDNKSWNYVCITRETLPQVQVIRGKNIKNQQKEFLQKSYQGIYGPFTNGLQLREAMKIIRRIFPYIDTQSSKHHNFEFYRQLGLTPDTKSKEIKNTYKKNISNLKLFFQGKKKKIILNLKKDMMLLAKKKEFEKAGEIKKRIFALEHINDVALISEETSQRNNNSQASNLFRIESYDIAHMSGKNMVGVMTVVEDGQVAKNEYKKFIIRTQDNANDTGALEEVLSRRFRHTEWGIPQLIVVDGSTAQINVAKRVLSRYQFDIPIVSVVKNDKHKAKAIMGNENLIKIHKKSILLSNSEAHRFAIAFHKLKRGKSFLK
ncbi:MAG: GIY-YIG nuclease family protein [Patescibacteria group bacterium]|nr:GIY-YIG nuclease family protein [Patescibacteria group bacterium]